MDKDERLSPIEQRVAVALHSAKLAAGSGAVLTAASFFYFFGGKAVVLIPAIVFVGAISALACYAIRASEG